MLRNGDAMMWIAMTTRQDATIYGRGVRAAVHLVALGKHLGLPKLRLSQVAMAGALLDIGKTALPLRLLTKPGQLSEDEFRLVKDHVRHGLDLLKNAAPLHGDIIRAIAEHHEREDGTGYPNGLSGGQIGLYGRMAAIVDTFMALTDERPFAQAMSPYLAFRRMTEWSRNLFHAPVTQQYIQAIGVFPVGSLVDLSSGEVAVVVRQNRTERLKPQVLIVADPEKAPLSKPVCADLATETLARDKPAPLTISAGLPAGSYGLDERHLRPA
jgi:HD-GYP domain-containing protein (c-di-GMP phosphodiesterase class II)